MNCMGYLLLGKKSPNHQILKEPIFHVHIHTPFIILKAHSNAIPITTLHELDIRTNILSRFFIVTQKLQMSTDSYCEPLDAET
jgi:hypothetical protein